MKRVAIVQSNYIPWKGYFDLIAAVDEFILYDDVQYTRRDWRNRNRIKTPRGVEWLTIPVDVKGKFHQRIRETRVADMRWPRTHWRTIATNYGRARYFDEYAGRIEALYLGCDEEYLSRINMLFMRALCEILGIHTRITWSMDYPLAEGRSERLVELSKCAGAQHYLSGPSAREYLDEGLFQRAGIAVSYMDYAGYPSYAQLYGPFEHSVSVLDLIFNEGPNAPRFM